MNITESIRLSFESLKSNKLRSFLCIVLLIIVIEHLGTVTCLVVDMI